MCGCRRPVGRPAASQSTAAVACGGVDRCENLHGKPPERERSAANDDRQPADAAGHAKVDPRVKQAAAIEPFIPAGPHDLVLPTDRKVRMSELRFEPGQHVRGRAGKRPLVIVKGNGLQVPCDNVRFEDVDFVWEARGRHDAKATAPAMINVTAQRGAARLFVVGRERSAECSRVGRTDDALPGQSGELVFTDCVFRGVQAVVDCQPTASLVVELNNSLCVAAGPILRLDGAPASGQTLALSLDHVTTRGDFAVLECRYARLEAEAGHIVIAVTDTALVTNPRGGLLILSGQSARTLAAPVCRGVDRVHW